MSSLPVFCISRSVRDALAARVGLVTDRWFNWVAADSPSADALQRLSFLDDSSLALPDGWLARALEAGCQPVLVGDVRELVSVEHFLTPPPPPIMTLPVDTADEEALRTLALELCAPERAWLRQWANVCIGSTGVSFGGLYATRKVWRAYAHGLSRWVGQSNVTEVLHALDLPDYLCWLREVQLGEDDFDWSYRDQGVSQDDDSFIPLRSNPACGLIIRDGRPATVGLLPASEPWPWDVSGAVRKRLVELQDAASESKGVLTPPPFTRLPKRSRRCRVIRRDSSPRTRYAAASARARPTLLPISDWSFCLDEADYQFFHDTLSDSIYLEGPENRRLHTLYVSKQPHRLVWDEASGLHRVEGLVGASMDEAIDQLEHDDVLDVQ
jgi:hypothetical protein